MHLSMVPQNRFGGLVEAALRVEQSTTTMYKSRQESKRSAPGTSQKSSEQYSKKRNNGRGYIGRGVGRGVRDQWGPQLLVVAPRVFLPSVLCVRGDTMGSVRDIVQGVSTMARKAILLWSALS